MLQFVRHQFRILQMFILTQLDMNYINNSSVQTHLSIATFRSIKGFECFKQKSDFLKCLQKIKEVFSYRNHIKLANDIQTNKMDILRNIEITADIRLGKAQRVTNRINEDVRAAQRQAIEYKWKNLHTSSIKLCQQEKLIELMFELIPHKGYKQLSHHESFKGITEANLKNIFYSNIRSISNFISTYLQPEESIQEIISMLKNRHFLLFASTQHEGSINLIQLRRKINAMKKRLVGHKRQQAFYEDQQNSKQREEIVKQYNTMKQLYKQYQLSVRPTQDGCKLKDINYWQKQVDENKWPLDQSSKIHANRLNQTGFSPLWFYNDL